MLGSTLRFYSSSLADGEAIFAIKTRKWREVVGSGTNHSDKGGEARLVLPLLTEPPLADGAIFARLSSLACLELVATVKRPLRSANNAI